MGNMYGAMWWGCKERASGRLQCTELFHVGQLKSCFLFAWTLSSPWLIKRNRLSVLACSEARPKAPVY